AWSDCKVAGAAVPPAFRDAHRDAPGWSVVKVPADAAPGASVVRLAPMTLPPGAYTVEVLDERGHPIPADRLSVAFADGRILEAAGAPFVVEKPGAAAPIERRYAGGGGLVI